MSTHTVVVQKWEEIEVGWGERPDGFSLHLSDQDRQDFIQSYWESLPDRQPSEYSRPDGTPYLADVDEETYQKVQANGGNLRNYYDQPPGSGGPDGWRRR